MTVIDGNTLEGVSATTLWTLHSRATEAKRSDDVTWYSIDLPPVMELRRHLLPRDDRIVELAQSALDRRRMDRVDSSHGTFITAEGLLIYLEPEDALSLIRDCAARFPGGQMMFDSIPRFFSQRPLKGFKLSDRYIAPPMPFSLSPHEGLAMAGTIPGFVRRNRPSMTLLEFG
jgi:O-methyltransferase involved in polyketide biosynthesis